MPEDGKEHSTKNMIKINVYVAVFEVQDRFGFGCIVRTSNGRLIAAKVMSWYGCTQPEVAEALSWAKEPGWR